jgi:D-xylose transport system ATP-binding protein
VADNIAVLYLGQMVAQVDAKTVNNQQVVELITAGRSGSMGLPDGAAAADTGSVPVVDASADGEAVS